MPHVHTQKGPQKLRGETKRNFLFPKNVFTPNDVCQCMYQKMRTQRQRLSSTPNTDDLYVTRSLPCPPLAFPSAPPPPPPCGLPSNAVGGRNSQNVCCMMPIGVIVFPPVLHLTKLRAGEKARASRQRYAILPINNSTRHSFPPSMKSARIPRRRRS